MLLALANLAAAMLLPSMPHRCCTSSPMMPSLPHRRASIMASTAAADAGPAVLADDELVEDQ